MAYFFDNGAPVPPSWPIVDIAANGLSARCVTPRGKRPRVYTAERLEALRVARVTREATREAARLAESAAVVESTEGFTLVLSKARIIAAAATDINNPFIARMAENIKRLLLNAENRYGWNERNTAWITEAVARFETTAARVKAESEAVTELARDEANWVPEGRITITGKVLSVKYDHGPYMQTKILLLPSTGAKVWGTLPDAIREAKKDDTVTLKATVKRKEGEPMFGFFSRPADAFITEVA